MRSAGSPLSTRQDARHLAPPHTYGVGDALVRPAAAAQSDDLGIACDQLAVESTTSSYVSPDHVLSGAGLCRLDREMRSDHPQYRVDIFKTPDPPFVLGAPARLVQETCDLDRAASNATVNRANHASGGACEPEFQRHVP